ncbi:nitroreductase/quinone reductase family protein [Nocardia carnea]|uniref:nitroreductase/quinone reductase family protein n=1 Tax=Nocardia carnea TaxID=37328 RepID=UPI0024548AD8|nr:nitroreductase/quinone reductase family protein [Nocardia carnea]
MDLRVSAFHLIVHDLDQALGFYCGVLGLEVRGAIDAHGGRRVRIGPPAQPEVSLVLEPPGAGAAVPTTQRLDLGQLPYPGSLGGIGFLTEDCDATFEYLEAGDTEVMQEPIDRPDGARDCAFLDPSGNFLRFVQPAPTGNGTTPGTRRPSTTPSGSSMHKIGPNPVSRLINRCMRAWGRRSTRRMMGMNLLVLHTTGRRTGRPRQSPVAWFPDGHNRWLIAASAAGADANPDWYHNLAARPEDVAIEIGGRGPLPVTAEVLTGTEREQAWETIITTAPRFAGYQNKTGRTIPVIRLHLRR